ncbi:MAG: 30S ribosomal protein S12 methylthiotransferase RimO [Geodermatophilaceae bacterium]|nr:30S ribosomal protein S12 methylthiotransferase RimO [Geodermatophilaceae bacterium]
MALLTLGCARNDVDSEELAGRLEADGYRISKDAESADAVLVNTCGFVDAAKRESVETLLAASDGNAKVIAVGCMAQRYGSELAKELPEATVLSFDDYATIGERVHDVLHGRTLTAHTPSDRRLILPIAPIDRTAEVAPPGHGWLRRRRLTTGPSASIKLASGCDRRCSFCAIPSFRGRFVSRTPAEILAEASWLAGSGVREVILVSENSTSYGKDFGDLQALEKLLPQLAAVDGIERIRVNYLQPAEVRPGLIEVIGSTPNVAPYFDLSFQHSAPSVLRRMRRFGSSERFLELLVVIRAINPEAGVRTNVIVGFPGETEADVEELEGFLDEARMDAIGVFGYSDEEGTEAETYDQKVPQDVIEERVRRLSVRVDELIAQRAEDRIGTQIEVLVHAAGSEDVGDDQGQDICQDTEESDQGAAWGTAAHQAPDVDGQTLLGAREVGGAYAPGDLVPATVVTSLGIDLTAQPAGGRVPV